MCRLRRFAWESHPFSPIALFESPSRDVCFSTSLMQNQLTYAHFSALGTDCIFSRALYRLHVFPRLAPDLAQDDVFPRLAPISCFVHRLLHLAFVSDAASFAFSFITSVKTEPFLLTTNWKNSMACLAFHSYWLVPRCFYSFD